MNQAILIHKANMTLEHISCFSVDERTGICHIEYTDRPECFKPMYKCADILRAIDILHRLAIDEYNKLCQCYP